MKGRRKSVERFMGCADTLVSEGRAVSSEGGGREGGITIRVGWVGG